MSALAVFLDSKICSMIFFLLLFAHCHGAEWIPPDTLKSMNLLVTTGTDIVKSTYELIDSIEYIKQNHMNTPSFEIGYLMFTTFEVYRKMIDKYNTSHLMNKRLYTAELVLYLEEIENHYWELDHLSSMLHEIERKYNVTSGLHTRYHEITSAELRAMDLAAKGDDSRNYRGRYETLKKFKIKQKVLDKLKPTKKIKQRPRFLMDYGWDYPDPYSP